MVRQIFYTDRVSEVNNTALLVSLLTEEFWPKCMGYCFYISHVFYTQTLSFLNYIKWKAENLLQK